MNPGIIAFNSILDKVFETTLSNCCCIHQIFLNCWWCLHLWWKTEKFFTLLKWILPTFDDAAAMLHNFSIIFNPCFVQIFDNTFSRCKIDTLQFAISLAMIGLDSIHLWTALCNVLISIFPPDTFCSLLIVCFMTWSGGNLLKLLLDLLTEKWPFTNLR